MIDPLTITCVCGALPGEPCVTSHGDVRAEIHILRTLIANDILGPCFHEGWGKGNCPVCANTGWRGYHRD